MLEVVVVDILARLCEVMYVEVVYRIVLNVGTLKRKRKKMITNNKE